MDLSQPTVAEQQRVNAENTAELTRFIRSLQPDGVTISVGGEIGEVGKSNSTEEELRAYLDGYLGLLGDGAEPISKVSVQTGTSHGGVVLPDGSVAEVSIDFDTLRRLSTVAREEYGFAGCVQHGASTLPEDAFHHFPENGTAEIHLATGFQNIIYDDGGLPDELRTEMLAWCSRTAMASASPARPRSNSSTRPARRRSARSSAGSGRSPRRMPPRSPPTCARSSAISSTSSASPGRANWSSATLLRAPCLVRCLRRSAAATAASVTAGASVFEDDGSGE